MSRDRDKNDRIAQSDLHNTRGIELADRKWLDEAIKEFRKAIELDPQSAHAHDNLATVYAEKGQLIEALREYMLAIDLEEDSPTAHYNLACFLATFSHNLAIDEYKKAISIEWDYPDAHLNLALTYAERGQFDEALEEYSVALKLDPSDLGARHELATVLMDLGRHSEAITNLREVVKQEPEHLDAWVDLGISYTTKGFYDQADKALSRALSLDSTDIMANYHCAALRAMQGRIEECLTALNLAAEADRDRVRAWTEADRLFDDVRDLPAFSALLSDS